MDHGKRRGAYRASGEADQIDLGHEPPLSVDGETSNLIDRRRVSVQWFSGTILTGLCGAALMGGAVFASLDGQSNFATVPERVQLALRGSSDRAATARKSDRLPPPSESNTQRRVIRDTQTSRVGNREIVRVRAFVRVASNLALSTSELSANIPAFNPLRMQAAEATPGAAPADDSPDAEVDAEVSFVTADLANVLPRAQDRGGAVDRRRARPRPRSRQLDRQHAVAAPRARAAARHATGLRGGRESGSLRRLRDPHRAGKRHPAAEDARKEATGGTTWSERTVTVRKGELGRPRAARARRAPGRHQGHHRRAGRPRPRRRRAREPQASRPAGADQRPQIHAADPRRDRERQRHRGGRRLVRSRPLCAGRHPQPGDRSRPVAPAGRGRGRRPGRAALPEHLRDRAAQSGAASADRRPHPHLFVRRRLPAPRAARRLVRGAVCRRGRRQPTARARCCSRRSRPAARRGATTASSRPTTAWSTSTTRPARARRSSWSASRSPTASCAPASATGIIRCCATPRCTPASTGRRRWERRSTPPATARSKRWDGKAATAATSASATPTATRPPTATCRPSPATWPRASASGRARSSAMSAPPASRPAPTCTTRSSSTAATSTR